MGTYDYGRFWGGVHNSFVNQRFKRPHKWPGLKFNVKRWSELLSSKASEDRKSSVQRFGLPLPTQGSHYIAYPVGSTRPKVSTTVTISTTVPKRTTIKIYKHGSHQKKTIQKHLQCKICNAKIFKHIVGGERIRRKLGRGRNSGCESYRRSLGFQVSQRSPSWI